MPLTGWGRRCKLLIDSTKVDADFADFPWLFTKDNLPSEMFDADGPYPALSGGGDIRFSADPNGNNRLSIEVVTFITDNNPALGKAEIWVKIPFVSSRTDTEVWVFYNKSGETQPVRSAEYGSESVWTDGFALVHHFNQNPVGSAPQMIDSTSNLNHGTSRGSTWLNWTSTDLVDAKWGKGLAFGFNGWDNCRDITVPDSSSLRLSGGFAIEVVVYQNNNINGTWQQFFMKGHSTSGGHTDFSYALQMRDPSTLIQPLIGRGSTLYGGPVSSISKITWTHLMSTFENVGPDYPLRLHKDGAGSIAQATSPTATDYDTTGCSIGNKQPQALWGNFDGVIEEVRVHSKYRSPEYAKLSYTTTFDFTATGVGTPSTPSTVGAVPMMHVYYRRSYT